MQVGAAWRVPAAILAFLALDGTFAARPAAAQESGQRFGERGQVIVTADRLVPIFGYTTQSITVNETDTETKTTDSGASFAFLAGREPALGDVHTIPRVAFDFTVLPRLTVGASIVLGFGLAGTHREERSPRVGPATSRESDVPSATLLGFAPRVGYVVPLAPHLAFWPRVGFAFTSLESSQSQTSNLGVTSRATTTDTTLSLDLDPQLVWTPIPHVLVHVGPLANLPLGGSHATSFEQGADAQERSDDLAVLHVGLSAGLGFWFF